MTAADLAAARWRRWAGEVHQDPRASLAGTSLAVIAAILLTLALSGGGRDVGPWTAFRLVVLALFGIAILGRIITHTSLSAPLAGVLAAVAVASIGSIRLQSSVDQFVTWGVYAATTLIVASAISRAGMAAGPERAKRVEWARRFVDAAVFTGGALCLVSLYWFWGARDPTMRWYSTFYWPNPFAGYLLLVLPVEVSRYLLAGSRRDALTHGAMAVLLGTAFILTFSRGAWLAAAVTAVVAGTLLRASLNRARAIRGALLVIVLAAAVYALTQGQAFRSKAASVLSRAASTADFNEYSLQGRQHFWRGAIEIFRDHPLRGMGPGTFAYVYPQYQRDVRFYSRDPHNLYAQMAAETGIVGLAALLWLLVAITAMGTRVIRAARGTPEFPWVAGVVFGLGAFWLHTGMEINWSFPAVPAMAFALMGVLAAYEARTARAIRSEPSATVRPEPALIKFLAAVGIALVMAVVGLQYAATAQFRTGQAAYAAGRWDAAVDSFARAAALNPLDARYPSALADASAKSGRPPTVLIPLVTRATTLDRANPYYWFQLALITVGDRTPAAALATERFLRHAVAIDPFHYPEAYQQLAGLYRRLGQPAKALEVYQQAAARYPDSVAQDFALRPNLWPGVVALFMDWAGLLTEQQHDAEAEGIFARIIQLEPRFAPAYVGLVRLYLKANRLQDAARVLSEGLAHAPNNGQLQVLRRELRARSPGVVPPEQGK